MSKLAHKCDAHVDTTSDFATTQWGCQVDQADDLTETQTREGVFPLNLLGELGVVSALWNITPLACDGVERVAS